MLRQLVLDAIEGSGAGQWAGEAGAKIENALAAVIGFHDQGGGREQLGLGLRVARDIQGPVHLTAVGTQASHLAGGARRIETGATAAMWTAGQHDGGDYRAAERLFPDRFPGL